ncbi:MAG TPA: nucleotidyltransferase domain-containing protein [Nocardioides sp.]|uniref:nucleotidyltransferase domain-containing protein n=1 Tax=Nocardioides sp. TaxID=35761 RepID=UPI002E32B0B9|nr:nucleotidyltransferase domain-containing protein [Nocardioides sp.]HEX5090130.1 nucleotidyltransferase domain-containing protein [Nocardioides sp.]
MVDPQAVLDAFGDRLSKLGWVSDLWVGGSLATGDHLPGVSDMDLVALVDGRVDADRQSSLAAVHRELDSGVAAGADLGCVYVDARELADAEARHPTWTHGALVQRILSGISRAELVRHGRAQFGRPPADVLPPMSDDDVREAARAEVCGYWAWAARRPAMWLDPVVADLGLTGMARGRYALITGRLLTKSEAVEQARAPQWLVGQLRARRRGEAVRSPRLRTAWIAWRDCRRTVRWVRAQQPGR